MNVSTNYYHLLLSNWNLNMFLWILKRTDHKFETAVKHFWLSTIKIIHFYLLLTYLTTTYIPFSWSEISLYDLFNDPVDSFKDERELKHKITTNFIIISVTFSMYHGHIDRYFINCIYQGECIIFRVVFFLIHYLLLHCDDSVIYRLTENLIQICFKIFKN